MAIAVSAEFKAIWEEKQGKAIHQRLGYKRRYKLAGTYHTEAAWTYLEKHEFVSLGSIPQQADVRRNVIKTTAMNVKVPNENNQWIEHASSPSFYAADNVATDGYKATRTLWRLEEGYELADGTIEWIAVFTGVQLKLPKITGKGEDALIEIYSNAVLLDKADAEEVCTEPGLENCIPATGDGTNVDFESTSTGVDHAKLFEVNGANRTQGSQWRVGNDNEIASAGNTGRLAITASTAPGAGQTVKTSVKKWLQNQVPETLLGLLADEAGIGSGSRSISSFNFPGGLTGFKKIDTQAEWLLGTLQTAFDLTSTPGVAKILWYIIDDFADGQLTSNPVWRAHATTDTQTGWSAASNKLVGTTPTNPLRVASTRVRGSWEFDAFPTSGYCDTFIFRHLPFSGWTPLFTRPAGYWLRITQTAAELWYNRGSGGVDVLLATAAVTPGSTDYWRVTRDWSGADGTSGGDFKVYRNGNGTAIITVTHATEVTFTGNIIGFMCYASATSTWDNIKFSDRVIAGGTAADTARKYVSEIFDLLSVPTAWSTLDVTETLNDGTASQRSTNASADGATFDGSVAVNGSNVIQSTLRRYVKLEATVVIPNGFLTSPEIDVLQGNFTTGAVFISLANHRGKTVMKAMEDIVKIPDYELRFRGDGTLVIAPKTASAYVLHLTQENGIIDVLEVDYGIPERVNRAGRVRYQGFVSIYGDAEAGASAETIADGDELSKAVIDEDLGSVIVANDLNLGDSRARVLYDNSRRSATDPRPPVRIRLRIWDAQWLEVSDVVRVDFYDHPLLATLQANDELLRADSPWLHGGAPGNVISASKDWRILYYNPNKDTGQADILCEEVL